MNARIKQILVVQETREHDGRTALTPGAISKMPLPRKYRILVESGAGLKAGFTDSDYVKAGAEIFSLSSDGFPSDTLILRVKRPDESRGRLENQLFRQNTLMIGFLDPLDAGTHVGKWQACGITTFSVDIFKSLAPDDPKNMQAAMSRIAGRLAFQDGIRRYEGIKPIKLTVIGTGPAALSASLEAKKHGTPVQIFGRKDIYRPLFEETGAKYHVFPDDLTQVEFLRPYLKGETIVIAAPRVAGVKPPLLMDGESLDALPKGAIVIDLTVNEGGCIPTAESDQVVVANGITILHVSGYPKMEPKNSSEAYAKCMIHLLNDVLSSEGELQLEHKLLQECWLTHKGERNSRIGSDGLFL